MVNTEERNIKWGEIEEKGDGYYEHTNDILNFIVFLFFSRHYLNSNLYYLSFKI